MKKIIISILLCVFFIDSYAQGLVPAAYQQARDLYDRLAYSDAIPLLIKECTGKNNRFLDADILLADCYRQTNQYALAEGEYELVTQDVRLKDNMQKLYYAQILQNNQKYEKAAIWYAKYLENYPNDKRAKNQMQACQNIQQFVVQDVKTSITNLPFNTNGYDFGATVYKTALYFTSTGGKVKDLKPKEINSWTGERFMNLYTVNTIENDSTADDYSPPVLLPASVNTKYNEGPLCFNKDKTKVYFTRNQFNPEEKEKLTYSKEKEANLSIYEATIVNGNWTNIRSLPFNSKQYSCGHPALDEENGILYFSSNMPDGFGGTDIWKVKFKDGGLWEKPINLGVSVNTDGDEMFPTFDNEKNFYFASDGLGGLGGLDIFSAQINDGSITNVHNIGAPVNSSYDDFGYLMNDDKTTGYFSSDRPSGKGEDDIYRFSNVKYKLDVLVIDKFTQQPVAASKVLLKQQEKAATNLNLDAKGNSSTEVESNTTYDLQADAPDYLPNATTKFIPANEKKPFNSVVIELQPMVLQVLVLSASTKKPIEAATVNNINSCNKAALVDLTNVEGKVNYFVKNNCSYTLTATARGYFPKPAVQITTTLKDTAFVVIELEQISDKPIVLNNIYYDFNKWDIRSDATPDLKMLLSFMQTNPDAIVELSSNTDARGEDSYNLELSQKRAQSAVNWLVIRGVNENNIKPVGYGETKPVNQCTNNIKCTEEEHQRNRRTEFRVLNAGQVIASQVKQDINVGGCKNCPF